MVLVHRVRMLAISQALRIWNMDMSNLGTEIFEQSYEGTKGTLRRYH